MRGAASAFFLGWVLLVPGAAGAADIHMLASNAVKQAWLQLGPRFEMHSGDRVIVEWAGTADITRRISDGEAEDVVIAPAATVDELVSAGRLAAGSRTDLAASPIGVAIRPGTAKPDLASGETLKRSLLAAHSIVISGGPSGIYLHRWFEQTGIAAAIGKRTVELAPGKNPADLLVRGEGDIAFTQVSELLPVKGIEYIGALPADVQQMTVFSAGLHRRAHNPAGARALVVFLTAPGSVLVLKNSGLVPLAPLH